MNLWSRLLLQGFVLLFVFLAGAYWGGRSDGPKTSFAEAKYQIRKTLKLPKNWYPLPAQSAPADRQPVPCPDPGRALVIATGGQSNAANENTRRIETAPDQNVFTWHDGRCFVTRDPVLGASGTGGSLWGGLGTRLARDLGRPVLLVNGAIGGTQIADWLDERSGYYHAFATRIAAARAAGFEPTLILWHQGETDAAIETDMALLKQQLQTLTSRLLADMPESRLYLFRTSKCIGARRRNGVATVRRVQTEVAHENSRIVAGMNTDLLDNDYRSDRCHFNSLGRAAIIEHIAPDLAEMVLHPDRVPDGPASP
ncbi:sialate O-acetylesterase [Actibacterium sp. D379-3]